MLDDKVKNIFTEENFIKEFKEYKEVKTDIYTGIIKINMGVDGVKWEAFEKNITQLSKDTCKRAIDGKYFFSPFREIEIPKPPYINLNEAKKNNKTRILSIATIRDVIFQKLLYKAIEEYCENKFNKISDEVSFAYRKNKSAPLAAQKVYHAIIEDNYRYIINGDIEKFFDEIPHDKLLDKLHDFFTEDNTLTIKYLKRFFSVDRVLYNDYGKNLKKYHKEKPKRTKRNKGIPQGGVMSGLVANIFLYDFDNYVVNVLYPKYNHQIKYIRYADDFVILFKDKELVTKVFNDVKNALEKEGLTLHDLGSESDINQHEQKKSLFIDMAKEKKGKLEFLGFEISPKGISIKKENITKFQNKIIEIINNTKIYKKNPQKGLHILIYRIKFKILGNHAFPNNQCICKSCEKEKPRRNWISYFLIITDVRSLRALDKWIRKQIYRAYYNKTGSRLPKKELIKMDLPLIEQLYYQYKKDNKRKKVYCNCSIVLDENDIEFNYLK